MSSLLLGEARPLEGQTAYQVFQGLANGSETRDKAALVHSDGDDDDDVVTYGELQVMVDSLHLWLKRKVEEILRKSGRWKKEEERRTVGLCLRRSPALVASVLAVWKLRWAFVPLDPSAPPLRTLSALRDARPSCCLVADADTLPEGGDDEEDDDDDYRLGERILDVADWGREPPAEGAEGGEEEEVVGYSLEDVACVLYTSGSCGRPKGVRLSMANLMNRLRWQWGALPFAEGDVCLSSKPPTFVDWATELLGPLLAGVPVVLLREEAPTAAAAASVVGCVLRRGVTRLVLVPSLLKAILLHVGGGGEAGEALRRRVRLWVSSGEALPASLAGDFFAAFPGGALLNLYGSTEVSGDVTWHRVQEDDDDEEVVPVGRPLTNTAVLVAREEEAGGKVVFRLLQEGQTGEILVLGRNVCQGYLPGKLSGGGGGPSPSPFLPFGSLAAGDEGARAALREYLRQVYPEEEGGGALLYRTGDLGRVVSGRLLFEGRRDAQVKVRGVRVHLAEVEDALQRSGYADAHCVLATKGQDDEQVLVAFVVLKGEFAGREAPVVHDLRRRLRTYLPKEALPRLAVVDALPLLPSGKVDRQGLLGIYRRRMSHGGSRDDFLIMRKEEPIESRVLRIICGALGVGRSPDVLQRNFFDLGGNSISSVSVVVRLRELGLDVTLDAFLRAPTIGDVVNGILKAKTRAEVMNLFCPPAPAGPCSASSGSEEEEEGASGGRKKEKEEEGEEAVLPALHPDLPVCPELLLLLQQQQKEEEEEEGKAKGIRLAHLHTLPLSQGVDRDAVVEVVAEGFATRNPLDVAAKVPRAAHRELLLALWPRLVQDDLSFVARDPFGRVLGVVVNTDLFREPEVEVPPSMEEVAALHRPLEEEARRQLLQEAGRRERDARWVHNLFLATTAGLTPQDNVRLVLHLEKELLRVARSRLYGGVFTVNSNPLNQLLCENYLGYRRRGAVRASSFVHGGQRPFCSLPDDLLLVAATKTV